MKYKVITFKQSILFGKSMYDYAIDYIKNGIGFFEGNELRKNVDNFEEALNMICSELKLKLISLCGMADTDGSSIIMGVFEELKEENYLKV